MKTLVGLLLLALCWTLLCSGQNVYRDNNGEPPDPDRLLDWLRSEDLILDTNKDVKYLHTLNGNSRNRAEADEDNTCANNTDCKNGAPCEGEVDAQTCQCKPGTGGPKCIDIEDCAKDLKNCAGPDGACKYDTIEEKAFCDCSEGKKWHPTENTCKETCLEDNSCQNGGLCKFEGGDTDGPKFCNCKTGLSGDKCEIVDDCKEETGIYKDCKGEDGDCRYNVTAEKATCQCSETKKLNPDKGICEECNCGTAATDCNFDLDGAKNCTCKEGNAQKEEICAECLCGLNEMCHFDELNNYDQVCFCKMGYEPKKEVCTETCLEDNSCENGGLCKFEDGKTDGPKFCNCKTGLSGDKCEIIDDCKEETGKYKDCKGEDDHCKYNVTAEKAFCQCSETKKFNPFKGICEVCSCENMKSCEFTKDGEKNCTCPEGFGLKVDVCTECLCGENSPPCTFTQEGVKKCECPINTAQNKAGICTECTCGLETLTCKFEGEDEVKQCTCIPEFQLKQGVCTATCNNDADCLYNGNCTSEEGVVDGPKFCQCKNGLSGSKCHIVDACRTGEYQNCTEEYFGDCKYKIETEQAVCTCLEARKWNPLNKICEECDCGSEMDGCEFTLEGRKNCTCNPGFAQKEDMCLGTCIDDDQCEYEGTCEGEEEGATFCMCEDGLSGANCTVINDCEANGIYKDCKGLKGTCKYEPDISKAVCACPPKKKLNPKVNTCEVCYCGEHMESCEFTEKGKVDCKCNSGYALKAGKTCTETCSDDCEHDSLCEGKEGSKFCNCKKGLSGPKCATIDACEEGEKYEKCHGDKGLCEYQSVNETVACICPDDKKLNLKNFCSGMCSSDEDCKGGKCEEDLCTCPEGYSGDFCELNNACVAAACEDADATCEYDAKTNTATCKCNDPLYVYSDKNKDCKTAVWCNSNPCNNAECALVNGIGTCKCESDKEYYDYNAGKCEKINLCIVNDVVCGDNKECDATTGLCKCMEGYLGSGEECKPNFCKKSLCFPGAVCLETEIRGIVKCECDEKSFYKDGKCYDGSCFLEGFEKNCTRKTCSHTNLLLKDGECVPKTGMECTEGTECGYGWCVKTGKDKKDTCVCKDKMHTYQKDKGGICLLKRSSVCPSGDVTFEDPMTCNCSGMHKQAENGITCEKRSCADDDVNEECNSQNGKCEDYWKQPSVKYKCACPQGQMKDSSDVCKDMCSIESVKESCYNKSQSCFVSEKGDLDCRCPPAFQEKTLSDGEHICDFDKGKHAYMLYNLPVQSKKYVRGDGIDSTLLTKDVIDAMKAMFLAGELEFARLYNYRKDNDVLLCEVWLHFQEDKMEIAERWSSEKVTRNETLFLPPALVLSSEKIDQVKPEELEFCSGTISKALCGEGSECKKNTCSCKPGFKVVITSIRKTGSNLILLCEDVNECVEKIAKCPDNSECVNSYGSYYCKCVDGYRKAEGPADERNQKPCTDLCDPNPCAYGSCGKINNTIDCKCHAGYGGSLCQNLDVHFAKANKNTVVVGAVLGTLLGVLLILLALYIRRQRKNSYSEDFTPAPRVDNAEMIERRPMRGVTNKAYM